MELLSFRFKYGEELPPGDPEEFFKNLDSTAPCVAGAYAGQRWEPVGEKFRVSYQEHSRLRVGRLNDLKRMKILGRIELLDEDASVAECIERWASYRTVSEQVIQNTHVNVAVPDFGLLTINEVMVLEDCCTNNLQTHLDDGFKILAVCPQSARRPDYVIGRHNSARK